MASLVGTINYQSAGSAVLTPGTAPTAVVTGANQAILVWIQQDAALTRTFAVSSSLDGSFGDAVGYYNPNVAMGAWVLRNASVGTHTLTVTASTSGASFGVSAQVVQDLGTGTPITDTQFATVNGASHVSAGTGATTSTGAFVLCVNCLSGNVTTRVAGSGYTLATGPSATSARVAQYQDFATALNAEQGAFTTTGTSRANRGLLVAFPEAADPSTPTAAGGAFTAWFGR